MAAVLVIPAPIGQLGNRLVHFAHLRAFALANGVTLLNTAFHPYADKFVGTRNSLFSVLDPTGDFYFSEQAEHLKQLFLMFLDQGSDVIPGVDCQVVKERVSKLPFHELDRLVEPQMRELVFTFGFVLRSWSEAKSFGSVDTHYLKFGDDAVTLTAIPELAALLNKVGAPLILLDGWGLRDNANLKLYRDRVLADLAPTDEVRAAADEFVETQRAILTRAGKSRAEQKLIGLHIRRGDYEAWQNGRYFFSWERYAEVAREIVQFYGRDSTRLAICASERPPHGFCADLPHAVSDGDLFVDQQILMRCDAIVGPPSTFSGWAAYVSGRPVIAIEPDGIEPLR
jgi:hypothetical protein